MFENESGVATGGLDGFNVRGERARSRLYAGISCASVQFSCCTTAEEDGSCGPSPASVVGVVDPTAGRERRFAAGLHDFGGCTGAG
jgi:hypothetical protein